MEAIIGLKEFRCNMDFYAKAIQKGRDFIVVKRSKPIFRVLPLNTEENWEQVVDFTKIKKGGVNIKDILSRL